MRLGAALPVRDRTDRATIVSPVVDQHAPQRGRGRGRDGRRNVRPTLTEPGRTVQNVLRTQARRLGARATAGRRTPTAEPARRVALLRRAKDNLARAG